MSGSIFGKEKIDSEFGKQDPFLWKVSAIELQYIQLIDP